MAAGVVPGRTEVPEGDVRVQGWFIVLEKWGGRGVLCHLPVLSSKAKVLHPWSSAPKAWLRDNSVRADQLENHGKYSWGWCRNG